MFMSEGPRIRMLEMGLCREYYETRDPGVIGPDGSVPERLCKLRDIQSPLARLRGFLGLLDGLPGLLFPVPYGILADARGRKLVAGACLLGLILRDTWTFVVLYFHDIFTLRAIYAAPRSTVSAIRPRIVSMRESNDSANAFTPSSSS